MNYLFVCTGNTCRSPMAEGFLKKRICEANLPHTAFSRGIMAFDNMGASENAVLAAKKLGADISQHLSHMLTDNDVLAADVILTMTISHKNAVLSAFPAAKNKVYTLGEYTEDNSDIPDPFGADINIYLKCAEKINSLIGKIKL